MNILGFMGWASHDPAACIIKAEPDGSFRYATIAEERLSRLKYSYHFPLRAIRYCMDQLDIRSIDEIDLVINDWSQHPDEFGSNDGFRRLEFDYIRRNLKIDKSKIRIIPSHHLAHAYTAFMPSGFDRAAILIVDGLGSDLEGTSLFVGKGNQIDLVESGGAFSLGKLYDTVTRRVLSFDLGEDGKTMGLAAFGEPFKDDPPILDIQGRYVGTQVDYSDFMRRIPDNGILRKFRPRQSKEELYGPYFAKVAWEVQAEAEKAMLHLAHYAKEKTGATNLCIAGGVGLNCVANEKIRGSKLFDNVFIQPASSDVGIPFGLALYGYYAFHPNPKGMPPFKHAYLGRPYPTDEIRRALTSLGVPFTETTSTEVAQLIATRHVVGWHTGGSEFGPRALGHRSILADPRQPDMKDLLNVKVKHREPYRPFAPSVLAERADEYFELNGDESPYMLLAPPIRKEKQEAIPAVVHVDGTGRVQTVTRESSSEYYDLISKFDAITGVPIILNTSFNDNNEPIEETPLDSLMCLLRTRIDCLVYNSELLVKKSGIPDSEALVERLEAQRRAKLAADYKALLEEFVGAYAVEEMHAYLQLHSALSLHHRQYRAYETLREFLRSQRDCVFVGDAFHHGLTLRTRSEFFTEPAVKVDLMVDDRLEHLDQVEAELRSLQTDVPVLVGLYNLAPELRRRFADQPHVHFLYDGYQLHLSSVRDGLGATCVNLAGVEDYSCEFNASKDFDRLFAGKVPVVVNASPHRK